MPEEIKKRKTHTSTAVKARYNAKVYTAVAFKLPKKLVADFKEKCAKDGVSMASVIKDAMTNFIK